MSRYKMVGRDCVENDNLRDEIKDLKDTLARTRELLEHYRAIALKQITEEKK